MLESAKKIIKNSKREVIYKVVTSLFIQGLALIIPVFCFYYLWSYFNQKTWYKFYNKLYIDFTSLTISKTKDIDNINLGEYTNILNNDIDIICNFIVNSVTRIFQVIEFFVIYSYFLSFNILIFLFTIIISIILLIVYIKYGKIVQELNIKRKASLDNKTIMLHKLYSSITNKKNDINSITNLFNKDNKTYLKNNLKYNVVIQKIIYIVLGIIEITRYLIILYSVYLVSIDSIEIGTILLIYSYYAKILTNFEVLGSITADYQSFIVSLKRLNKITVQNKLSKT